MQKTWVVVVVFEDEESDRNVHEIIDAVEHIETPDDCHMRYELYELPGNAYKVASGKG